MLASTSTDQIFGRLHIRYGAKLSAAYQGLDMGAVKADWADVLDGCSEHSVAYALVNLPIEWPPTAGQFRELCNRAPSPKLVAINAPSDPAARARGIERLRSLKIGDADPRAWIRRLIERQDRGEKLNNAQVHCLTEALTNLGLSTGAATAAESDAERTRRLKAESVRASL